MFYGDVPRHNMDFWTWYHNTRFLHMHAFFEVHDNYSVSVMFLGLLTSTVLIAEIREAPHVSQSDDFSGHREDKLQLVAPLSSFCHLHLGVRDDLQRPVQPVRRVHLGRDLFLSCRNIKACLEETRDSLM